MPGWPEVSEGALTSTDRRDWSGQPFRSASVDLDVSRVGVDRQGIDSFAHWGCAMFIQVIEGRTSDASACQAQLDRWQTDCRPGAIGYQGSTAGITEAGDFIVVARFTDTASARANSQRPEQSRWWSEFQSCMDGDARFHETEDVVEMRHGKANDADFVQVMEGHVADRQAMAREEDRGNDMLADLRPDLLGTTTAYFDDGQFTELAYFTSEAEARRNESLPMPDSATEMIAVWQRSLAVERYLDLTHPMLATP